MWGLVFPGQGSQHIGMGKFLYDNFPEAKLCFEEASDALSQDFKKLCFEGSESDLTLTENTQPVLVLVSTATYRVLKSILGINAIAGSGHSVGEYSAIVAAGGLKFFDALRLVRIRGKSMQSAVPVGQGGMIAIMGLEDEDVRKLCKWAEIETGLTPLEPANYNSPGQVVASGNQKIIDWLKDNVSLDKAGLSGKKAKLIPLKVSAPFHSSMMLPAQKIMEQELNKVEMQDLSWPVIQNFYAQPVTSANELKRNLVLQVSGAVKWTQCVNQMQKMGINKIIECGCGKVLSGLIKKIDSTQLTAFNINSLEELKNLEAIAK